MNISRITLRTVFGIVTAIIGSAWGSADPWSNGVITYSGAPDRFVHTPCDNVCDFNGVR